MPLVLTRLLALLVIISCAPFPAAMAQSLVPQQQSQDQSEAPAAGSDYEALADILENDQTRSVLIEELRRLSGAVDAPVPPVAEEVSVARRIAGITNALAEGFVAEIGEAYDRIAGLEMRAVSSDGVRELGQAALDLAVVVVGVIATLLILRLAATMVYRRASDWVTGASGPRVWLKRIIAALGCSILDLAIVVVGWVVGYLVALFVMGEGGRMDTRQALFLNAFLVIEIIKVAIRLFFATRYDGLRLLPIRGEDAAYWYTWLSRAASFLGYGLMVVVPIVSFNLGAAVGGVLAALIHAIGLLMAVIVIRQNRRPVKQRLQAMAERSNIGFARLLLGTLARVWHLIAIAYFAVLAILLLVQPETAISFMIAATLQTVVALAAGMLLSAVIDKAIRFGVRLKPQMRTQFPMLEERLNAFVPTTLKVARIVIAVIVAALVLDAWNVFDLFDWVGSDRGLAFVGTLVTVILILGATFVIWLLVSSWIEYRLNLGGDDATVASSARERTLLTIFRNAFTIALVVMALMITLSELGLDIGPLLAGAGVLGLAIGFGAQKLVQDVITGVFIQLENAIYTGDVVTAAGITGVVERLTVRSVGLRDLSGTYHLIPFSSVDTVSNFMRGFGYHVGEYGIAYREDVDEVIEVLKLAFEELRGVPENAANIIGDLEVHGITAFADSSVNVRVRIKTLPGQQWGIGRTYNGIVKKRFDAAGIEIPFPHVTLYFGEDKKGMAPAAPVRLLDTGTAIIGEDGVDAPETTGAKASVPSPGRAPRTRRKKRDAPPEQDIPSEEEI
ncbi:mechanosensitive ion channel domain-containing protein [Mesorhizobium sp. CAU 1741]|uniref:mechanosensitive ion channel domain-containing protein n=1 Tax=Mesorhizobium sp. CAU 1741 TaxID=3140366 RepID=UPI00325B31D5